MVVNTCLSLSVDDIAINVYDADNININLNGAEYINLSYNDLNNISLLTHGNINNININVNNTDNILLLVSDIIDLNIKIIDATLITAIADDNSDTIMAFSERIDKINDITTYRGQAAPGTTDAEALWRIRRITFFADGDVVTEWANGSEILNQKWTDRLTLTYS